MKPLKLYSLCAVMLLIWSMARAEDYNPTNPPDPGTMYRVSTKATPESWGVTSGTGYYKRGTTVYINTSSTDTDYEFKHWLLNGTEYSNSRGFYYTVTAEDVTFTAIYEYKVFNPTDPDDPMMNYKWKMSLKAEPEEACSFNINNGTPYAPEAWVNVAAYPNQGFIFDGWYENGTLVSDAISFNYEMGRENVLLTARFHYDPISPSDPGSSGQTNVDNSLRGDTNGDGKVNAQDVVATVNRFLNNSEYESKFDLNHDGKVNAVDVTAIVNIFLKTSNP